MKMIEIVALENGAHRNQTFSGVLPDGWAVDHDNLCRENFPFGEVEAEEVNGVMTVTKWTPGMMPAPEENDPIEETDIEATIIETLIDQEIRISELELMML